jgi:putative hydrolase of the HAD superfamily
MLASIWLQVVGEQRAALQSLIASLAAAHGTVPFDPHLTVCGGPDLDRARWDAVADYVRRSTVLPLTVRRSGISYSTTVWSRAVIIDIEDDPAIAAFRGELSRIAGAAIQAPPHISLLYTRDERGQPLSWAASETRLRAIAEDCAARVEPSDFVLGTPAVVAPDGDWANIRSWKVMRGL